MHELRAEFNSRYGGETRVYRAPGRVNLIGEHTDYNDGFVMPAAIEFSTWVTAAPREDRKIAIYSKSFSEEVEFDLDEPAPQRRGHWSDYPRGVAVTLESAGHRLRGANLLINCAVPIGSGLSSSAAIEVATGYALLDISDADIDLIELAQLSQRAENEFVGMRCGLMDQFASCFGRRDHALSLDCRSLEYELLRLPAEVSMVICNTMVKHELAGSEYNVRRAECEIGVKLLSKFLTGVQALRDVSLTDLQQYAGELPAKVVKRCHHVVSENERVIAAGAALKAEDLQAFGQLMGQSHASLRDDYQVSCPELDLMVNLANEVPGMYGARMTGGGFGGCTINLVSAAHTESFRQQVAMRYAEATGIRPEIYISAPAQGVERVE